MPPRKKKVEDDTPKPKDRFALGKEVIKLVDLMHEEKRIAREVIFNGIESAIRLAAERHFGVEEGVAVQIDRSTGEIMARHGEAEIDPETLGRIAAQSAKQVMIQKIREAESDTVFSEYNAKKGDLVVGTITRLDSGTAIVSLGKTEAILPRSEQIPGETHQLGQRIKAVIFEVRKAGQRVKVVLSRAHPDFVKALFEDEIPEVADSTIDIRAIAREAGYRTKLAVVSIDTKVDCVGACVGVRGSRIKNIIDELNGERIDIVRWNESLQVLIPYALQPAQISDVFTYPRLGRAIVMVEEDQLSLAIGRRGQNVRLGSKLVGLDLEIMTQDELGEALDRAERWFRQLPHVSEEHVQAIIGEGFLSYNELTFIDEKELAIFTGIPEEQGVEVIDYAEQYKDMMEKSAEEERRQAEESAEMERRAAAEADAQAHADEGEVPIDPVLEEAVATDPVAEQQPEEAEEAEANPPPAHVSGSTETPEHPNAYHESMPTDTAAVEQAVIDEEIRTGEDGEMTTPNPKDTNGATA